MRIYKLLQRSRVLFFLVCFLLAGAEMSAQDVDAEFLSLGLRDGLAGNQVNVIYKSRDGFLPGWTTSAAC